MYHRLTIVEREDIIIKNEIVFQDEDDSADWEESRQLWRSLFRMMVGGARKLFALSAFSDEALSDEALFRDALGFLERQGMIEKDGDVYLLPVLSDDSLGELTRCIINSC